MSTINEQLNKGQNEYGVTSTTNYFKFKQGDNRLRILTAGEVLATHFFGKGQKASTCYGMEKGCPFHGEGAPKGIDGKEKKPSIKYTCYVIDRSDVDARIQLADLPYSVIKQIGDYQENIDYSFDGFPMPYDVTIKYNPDSASPNDMYKVMPSPKREEVSDEVKALLTDQLSKQSPQEHVEKKKVWQKAQHEKEGIINKKAPGWLQQQMQEQAKKIESGELPPVDIEGGLAYPESDISPDDIPF